MTKTEKKVQVLTPETAKKVRYTINLDWFEVLFSGQLIDYESPLSKYEYDQGRIRLVKKDMPTKLFKYSYDLFFNNRHFAHINLCPRNNAIIKPDTIQFQAKNNVLYESGFIEDVIYISRAMAWKMLNISRLDIAIDGVDALQICRNTRTELNHTGKWEKLGRADFQFFTKGKRGKLTGYNVGSPSSSKWLTVYDKTLELQSSNKNYIKEMWDKAGIDTSKNVERIELKLRNEAIKMVVGFDWTKLSDFEYLASVFRSQIKNLFEFVDVNDKETNTSRKKKMTWIDWEYLGAAELPKYSTKQSNEVYRMKMCSKTMYGLYIQTGQQYFADLGQEIAQNVNCLTWYIDRLERWKEFFEKKTGKNDTGEVYYRYLASYKQYKETEQLKLYTYDQPLYVPRY